MKTSFVATSARKDTQLRHVTLFGLRFRFLLGPFVVLMLSVLLPTKVMMAQSSPLKLNMVLPEGRRVYSFQISPDAAYAVYEADPLGAQGTWGLFSVPITGGESIQLFLPSEADQHAQYAISPDSSTVVFRAESVVDGLYHLYSVPLQGGATAKEIAANVTTWFEISPDSQYVVFTSPTNALYSVPIGGGTQSLLGEEKHQGHFRISADGQRVVFEETNPVDVFEDRLVSVHIDGGGRLFLDDDDPFVDYEGGFELSPDGSRVLFLEMNLHSIQNDINLYSTGIAGGSPILLNGPIDVDERIKRFRATDDGTRVVYTVGDMLHEQQELYSVPIGGGSAIRLNETLEPMQYSLYMDLSPDSKWAVYSCNVTGDFVLYDVSLDGGPARSLSPAGQDVYTYRITPDSSAAIFVADLDADGAESLCRAALAGGSPAHLVEKLDDGLEFDDFEITADDRWVVFTVQGEVPNYDRIPGLYAVPVQGGEVIQLNGALIAEGDIQRFGLSRDGRWVVYMADQERDQVDELYSVDLYAIAAADTFLPMVCTGLDPTPDVHVVAQLGSPGGGIEADPSCIIPPGDCWAPIESVLEWVDPRPVRCPPGRFPDPYTFWYQNGQANVDMGLNAGDTVEAYGVCFEDALLTHYVVLIPPEDPYYLRVR